MIIKTKIKDFDLKEELQGRIEMIKERLSSIKDSGEKMFNVLYRQQTLIDDDKPYMLKGIPKKHNKVHQYDHLNQQLCYQIS